MAEPLRIDCGFPGGNIILDKVEGDRVFIRQDQRDTRDHFWFYWSMRVRGAAGRSLTFTFTDGDCLAGLGPAVSTDGGRTWDWLGPGTAEEGSFRYRFPAGGGEVRFCLAVPYLGANLEQFLARFAGNRHLEGGVLCTTRKGRRAELLRAGRLDGRADHRVAITCRHHCCEMMASYAVEGIVESVLAEGDDGRWFRDRVELLVVPFVDKDGVEEGDQGKLRHPHDHARDYCDEPLYPETAAIRRLLAEWSGGRLHLAADMHCPWIRGDTNEDIYFVGSKDPAMWERVGRFSKMLEQVQAGELKYDPRFNMAWGKAWNTYDGPPRNFGDWVATLPGLRLSLSNELPYAIATGRTVTADSARGFGRDIAAAIRRYLETETR